MYALYTHLSTVIVQIVIVATNLISDTMASIELPLEYKHEANYTSYH